MKDSRKGYMGDFRVRKGKGEIFYLHKTKVLGKNILKNDVSQYMWMTS